MADRTLTWHYGGLVHSGTHDLRQRRGGAQAWRLDGRWVPVAYRLSLGQAGVDGAVVIDINGDGASIFDGKPQLDQGALTKRGTSFKDNGREVLEDGTVLTLDIDQTATGASALTVELDLEAA